MTLTIDIATDQLARFLNAAQQLGVKPEELDRPREDFERAADYVLRKNQKLYERLG
jgi:hypothetical protein